MSSHPSARLLFMHFKALVLNDPPRFWRRGFHALPQPVRANAINARGSIQRSSPRSRLSSGPAGLRMTVSPSWEQQFSKELKNSRTQTSHAKKKRKKSM